jgi:hypothetical protein
MLQQAAVRGDSEPPYCYNGLQYKETQPHPTVTAATQHNTTQHNTTHAVITSQELPKNIYIKY